MHTHFAAAAAALRTSLTHLRAAGCSESGELREHIIGLESLHTICAGRGKAPTPTVQVPTPTVSVADMVRAALAEGTLGALSRAVKAAGLTADTGSGKAMRSALEAWVAPKAAAPVATTAATPAPVAAPATTADAVRAALNASKPDWATLKGLAQSLGMVKGTKPGQLPSWKLDVVRPALAKWLEGVTSTTPTPSVAAGPKAAAPTVPATKPADLPLVDKTAAAPTPTAKPTVTAKTAPRDHQSLVKLGGPAVKALCTELGIPVGVKANHAKLCSEVRKALSALDTKVLLNVGTPKSEPTPVATAAQAAPKSEQPVAPKTATITVPAGKATLLLKLAELPNDVLAQLLSLANS